MPFNNFENRHFMPEEENKINEILTEMEEALANKLANLSPEERQQFGSINEQNKLIVNKVKEYSDTEPELSSPDVDWEEFRRDFRSRTFLETLMRRLANLQMGLNNAKILHDWDNYRASLVEYDYVKYKNATATPGYENKLNDLGQFFASRGNRGTTETEEETPPTDF
ncbi:MAG: hypothetical protein Aureis2KO_25300 [Aureisphaera sp.]